MQHPALEAQMRRNTRQEEEIDIAYDKPRSPAHLAAACTFEILRQFGKGFQQINDGVIGQGRNIAKFND